MARRLTEVCGTPNPWGDPTFLCYLYLAAAGQGGEGKEKGWHSRRVVSVLDSGAEGPGFKFQSRRCRVLGKLFTPIVPLFQAAKLVAAILRVATVTVGPAESNGSLPPGL